MSLFNDEISFSLDTTALWSMSASRTDTVNIDAAAMLMAQPSPTKRAAAMRLSLIFSSILIRSPHSVVEFFIAASGEADCRNSRITEVIEQCHCKALSVRLSIAFSFSLSHFPV